MAYTSDKKHPGEVHLYIGTLENPENFAPRGHVHAGEQLPWFEVEDELPRFEKTGKGGVEPMRKGPKARA